MLLADGLTNARMIGWRDTIFTMNKGYSKETGVTTPYLDSLDCSDRTFLMVLSLFHMFQASLQ